jgi:RNA polymerase sigma-70 factor (ECF subfamily)
MNDFAMLYQRYFLDVYRFALSLSGNAAQAEDIASETFARVWLVPTELRLGTVKAYLLTIARHLFLKGLRREARQVELDDRPFASGADHVRRPRGVPTKRAGLRP